MGGVCMGGGRGEGEARAKGWVLGACHHWAQPSHFDVLCTMNRRHGYMGPVQQQQLLQVVGWGQDASIGSLRVTPWPCNSHARSTQHIKACSAGHPPPTPTPLKSGMQGCGHSLEDTMVTRAPGARCGASARVTSSAPRKLVASVVSQADWSQVPPNSTPALFTCPKGHDGHHQQQSSDVVDIIRTPYSSSHVRYTEQADTGACSTW
jgi:hypothetical protein